MIAMSVMLEEQEEQLITLRLYELLEKFGAGKAAPGAGSYAALQGMFACELCLTVIKFTKGKDDYAPVWPQLGRMEARLGTLEAKLSDAFQRDSDEWAYVVEVRLKRNAEVKGSAKRKQLSELARSLTEKATYMLLEICEPCIEVTDIALDLMNIGYTAVRGDTSGAISGGLSGADTAIATAYFNLQSFRDEREASMLRRRVDALRNRAQTLRVELNSKITELRAEGLQSREGALEALPLAARNSNARRKDKDKVQISGAAVKERRTAQSDEEIFNEIFMGKKRGGWFIRIRDFFTLQGIGTFAANKGFLHYVKQAIDENKYRSAGKLTNDVLLKWYKAFDARERREGPGL
jgi:formiminotetrahydrofolate cyclodeaminase